MRQPIILWAFLAGSCSQPADPNSAEAQIEQAQSEVKAKLRDASSATFSDVRRPRPGVVCGSVNSKNAFGGYAGDQRFIWLGGVELQPEPPAGYRGPTLDAGQTTRMDVQAGRLVPFDFQTDLYRKYGC